MQLIEGYSQTRFWDWRFFAIAMLLMAPEASLQRRQIEAIVFSDTALPIPSPGDTVIFSVFNPNPGHSINENFSLTLSSAGHPKNKYEMMDLNNFECQFHIGKILRDGRIDFSPSLRINSSFGNINTHEVGFRSDGFNLPAGQNFVALKNAGCNSGYNFSGGMVRISQNGENLLLPLGAALLRNLGWILATIGFGLGLVRYIRAGRNS